MVEVGCQVQVSAGGDLKSMKVSGFTFCRNVVKFDFPVVEAITSILPVVDECIVNVGKSEDETLELVRSIKDPRIKIVESVWDETLTKDGKILGVQQDIALSHCTGDWAFLVQGDEVIHEEDLPAIKRAMAMNIGEGLWRVLKGTGNLAMTAGSAGAGLVMGLLIAGAEMLGKILFRVFEVAFMNRSFNTAKRLWAARDSANALHKRPHAFGEWYRTQVLKAPALAVLTLNSGICGDKMAWLQMYDADGKTPISPEQFGAGTAHLDSLKVWGAKYLRDAGFVFQGTDNLVSALIRSASGQSAIGESFAKNPGSVGAKVWDWTVRAAT
jgi:hypothetical protein